MASAGKNQVKAPKVTGSLYNRQIAAVRGAWETGQQIRAEELSTRFPDLLPRRGTGNAGWFLEQARKKKHIDSSNRLLPVERLDKTGGRTSGSLPPQGRIIPTSEYEALRVALYTQRKKPFERWEEFTPARLKKEIPAFADFDTSSIGTFLRWLCDRDKRTPEIWKQGNGSWKLTDEGKKAQAALRKAHAEPTPPPAEAAPPPEEYSKAGTSPAALEPPAPPAVVDTVPSTLVGFFGKFPNAVRALRVLLQLAGDDGWVPALTLARGIRQEFGWPENRPAGHNLGRALQGWGRNFQELESAGSGAEGDLRYRIKIDGCELLEVEPPSWATRYIEEEEVAGREEEPPPFESPPVETPPPAEPEPTPVPERPRFRFVRREVYDRAVADLLEAKETVARLETRVEGLPNELQGIIESALQRQATQYEQTLAAEREQHAVTLRERDKRIEELTRQLSRAMTEACIAGELEEEVIGLREELATLQQGRSRRKS